MKQKIGILGSGVVARSLGAGFLKHGYAVMLGTRDASKLKEWQENAGKGVLVGSFADAAAFGEVVVLAVAGRVATDAINLAGPAHLNGKVVIDATNPIEAAAPLDGVLPYFTQHDRSLMEQHQNAFPEVRFVKAFSCVGSHLMVNPPFETKPTMFICGNDATAKATVTPILELFGWEVADMGSATAARAIEPLAMLWCIPGILHNEWAHAFRLMKL